MSENEIMEGEGLPFDEKIEESLAEEREAELERLLYRDEHQAEESPIKKKLRKEAERECLARLESAARTEDDFREIVRQYDRIEENRNRRFRYHETIRGDVPLEYGMAENPAVFPAYRNNTYWKSIQSGNFLEIIFDCPHEIDRMTSHGFISGFLRGMKDEYKELLYWLAVRGYGTAELGRMPGQSDRNVRKKYSRLLARIREKLYKYLLKRDVLRFRCKGFRMTSVKTRLGVIVFRRRVYTDRDAERGKHCVFLLDEDTDMESVGLTEKALCEEAAALACMTSYRNAAEILTANSGAGMSAMGVWNIVQALGKRKPNAWSGTRNWRRKAREGGHSPRPSCMRKTTAYG